MRHRAVTSQCIRTHSERSKQLRCTIELTHVTHSAAVLTPSDLFAIVVWPGKSSESATDVHLLMPLKSWILYGIHYSPCGADIAIEFTFPPTCSVLHSMLLFNFLQSYFFRVGLCYHRKSHWKKRLHSISCSTRLAQQRYCVRHRITKKCEAVPVYRLSFWVLTITKNKLEKIIRTVIEFRSDRTKLGWHSNGR